MRTPHLYKNFNIYRFFDIYQSDRCDLHDKVMAMWARNASLPQGVSPEERAKQVVLVALDQDDKAVAVNTVYDSSLDDMGVPDKKQNLFHAYRMFVEPGKTKMWLPIAMTCGTFDILKKLNTSKRYTGVIIRTDNPKVAQRSSLAQFARQGWPVFDHDPQGRVIMRRDFECTQGNG